MILALIELAVAALLIYFALGIAVVIIKVIVIAAIVVAAILAVRAAIA